MLALTARRAARRPRLDDVVIDRAPVARLLRIDEGEGERAEPEARRELDGLAVGAGHPHRRVRLLHRLGQHVAAGHREGLALEAGIGLDHHHVGDLLRRLERHRPLLLGGDVEAAELEPRGALADAEIDPAVGDDVERGDAFGGARRVVVVRDHLADAVAEADAVGQRRGAGEEDLGRRGVRILLEEVMLDLPGIVVAEPVGEHDLVERLVEQPLLVARRPGPRQLQLVEHAESHGFRSSQVRRHGSRERPGRPARRKEDSPRRHGGHGEAVFGVPGTMR